MSLLMAPAWFEIRAATRACGGASRDASSARYPGQAAGHSGIGVLAGHGKGSQDRLASLETGRGQRRRRCQLDGLLADPVGGSRFDPAPQLVPAVVAELPGEHRRRAGPPGDRLDHQAVEVGEHVATTVLVAAPPGGDRRQQEGLAEEVLGQPGKVG